MTLLCLFWTDYGSPTFLVGTFNILFFLRWEIQIWWGIQPWVAEVFPLRRKAEERLVESREEEDRKTRAGGRVREEEKESNHNSQREPPNMASQGS